MTDNLKSFLEAVSEDKEFIEKLTRAESPEAVTALANEKGFALTPEDLTQETSTGELSDDELDDVAGGAGLASFLQHLVYSGRRTVEMDTLPYRRQQPQNMLRANTLEHRENGNQPQADDLVYRSFGQDDETRFVSL